MQNNQSPTPEEWKTATDYALSMSSNMSKAERLSATEMQQLLTAEELQTLSILKPMEMVLPDGWTEQAIQELKGILQKNLVVFESQRRK